MKAAIALLLLLLMITVAVREYSQELLPTQSSYVTASDVVHYLNLESSTAEELLQQEYQDSKSYVDVRYFPTVPYDPTYPTANEEFIITFTCKQGDWYSLLPPWHITPDCFYIFIFFQDECKTSNYTNFERGKTTLGGETASFHGNYTKEDLNSWLYLGYFLVEYHDNIFWKAAQKDGELIISIMNDAAQQHQGHHARIESEFLLVWSDGTMSHVFFILGPLEVSHR